MMTGELYTPSAFTSGTSVALIDDEFTSFWDNPITGEADLGQDARYNTKTLLQAYIDADMITYDDDMTLAKYGVMYAEIPYHMLRMFVDLAYDLIYGIGKPQSTPEMGADKFISHYNEKVPVHLMCVDKEAVTGERMSWKAEQAVRSILETNPFGSLWEFEVIKTNTRNLGSTILYDTLCTLSYTRRK